MIPKLPNESSQRLLLTNSTARSTDCDRDPNSRSWATQFWVTTRCMHSQPWRKDESPPEYSMLLMIPWKATSRVMVNHFLSWTLIFNPNWWFTYELLYIVNAFLEETVSSLYLEIITLNTIFNILREWDPLIIILSIWTPKSHVRLTSTRLYFRPVISI